jgi:hypothetical protein
VRRTAGDDDERVIAEAGTGVLERGVEAGRRDVI